MLNDLQHAAIHGSAETAGRQRLLAYLRECDVPGAAGWPEDRSPFPGLRPFEPDMHRAFFGRQTETDAVVRLLRSAVERDDRHVLVVVGPSGCGKSSLVRAGVLAAISREVGWAVVPPASPGAQPLAGLARSFAEAMTGVAGWTASLVRHRLATEGLLDVATDSLTARSGPPATQLLLVIDQFEEVLTRADATGRQQLAKALAPAVDAGVVRVVTTMRSEFLDPLLAGGEFAELAVRFFPLRPLDARLLPTVIEAPMRLAGLRVAPELVSRMVADTDSGESLPLLAYTLQQVTMDMRRGDELTTQIYDNRGGVRGTLIREAAAALEEAVAPGGRSDSDVLRTLLRMVAVDENGHVSRRAATYNHFDDAGKADVDTFVRRRLLVTRTEPTDANGQAGEEVSVIVAHESFLSEWPPLAKMVETHSAALRMRVTVEDAAADWASSGRRHSYLWNRTRLANGIAELNVTLRRPPLTRPTMQSPTVDLSPRAVEFVTTSVWRNQQRRRLLITVVAAALIVSFMLTSMALRQRQEAVKQRDFAVAQQRVAIARELVTRAERLRGSDVRQALKLGLAAEQIDPNPSSRASLATTLTGSRLTATISHDQQVTEVAFSPDGHTVAAATFDFRDSEGTVQLWDVTSRTTPIRTAIIPAIQGVTAVAFSSDGHTLAATTSAASGDGGTVQLWDVTSRTAPARTVTLPNDQNVTAVAFSPDGHTLAATTRSSIGSSGTTQLWDITDRTIPIRTAVIPNTKGVIAVAFSPDGHTFAISAASGPGGTVQLWDLADRATPTHTATIPDIQGLAAVAFSSDRHTLAVTSTGEGGGGTVQLWDITDRAIPTRTATITNDQNVTSVAFGPDGHTLAITTGAGGTVQLWDLADRATPTRTAAIPNIQSGTSAAFSPDGHTLATTSIDNGEGGTVYLWDVADRTPAHTATIANNQGVIAVAFSPDGHTFAITGDYTGSGGTVYLWDATDRAIPIRTATIPDPNVIAVAFNPPDGNTLAIIGGGTVQLWDVTDRAIPIRTATIPDPNVTTVAFSSDGHTLAAISLGDGGRETVQLWDVTDRATPIRTASIPIDQNMTAVTFGPDGNTLAINTGEFSRPGGTVQLWDVADRATPIRTATIPNTQGDTAAFSPDGHTLTITTRVSPADPETVQLWDVTDRATPIRTATIPNTKGGTVAFSPDGHTLATPGEFSGPGTVQLWDITDRTTPIRTATIPNAQGDTMAFSPDGRTLATTTISKGIDGSVRLWDVEWITSLSGQIHNWSCSAAGGGLAEDEWSRLVPDIQYRQSC